MKYEHWIQTYTIRQFWPLSPRPEDVTVEDIAHALSNLCRFTGHTREFYSVAQHSVLVSDQCRCLVQASPGKSKEQAARWGLLHDASEAYLADVARPIKRAPEMDAYRQAETELQAVIYARFGLVPEEPAYVKKADMQLCYTEARDLFKHTHPAWKWYEDPLTEHIEPLAPREAKLLFLNRFAELFPNEARS